MSSFGVPLYQATLALSAAANDEELVAAMSAKQIKIAYIFAMSDTAMTLSIESKGGGGTDRLLWRAFLSAYSGFQARAHDGQWLTESDEADSLVVTTSASGNVFVSILYTYE